MEICKTITALFANAGYSNTARVFVQTFVILPVKTAIHPPQVCLCLLTMLESHTRQRGSRTAAKSDRQRGRREYDAYCLFNNSFRTEIVPFSAFYLAEDYHQKYRLQQVQDLMQEFRAIYPDLDELVDSTAVVRVNGYLGGHGTVEQLKAEIERFGLSPEGQQRLLEVARGRLP